MKFVENKRQNRLIYVEYNRHIFVYNVERNRQNNYKAFNKVEILQSLSEDPGELPGGFSALHRNAVEPKRERPGCDSTGAPPN
jgi:hypothetical protein